MESKLDFVSFDGKNLQRRQNSLANVSFPYKTLILVSRQCLSHSRNLSRRYVWLLAILIGSFFGYLIFKSRYTTPYSSKLQAGQNYGKARTVNATESVATSTKDIVTTEIPTEFC